jgi:mono/diheme cytochrome c family protein
VRTLVSVLAVAAALLAHHRDTAAQTPAAGTSPPPAQSAAAVPAGDAARGKTVYLRYSCYACHGYAGHSGPGGRLVPMRFPLAAFGTFVRNPPTMPPYTAKVLTDQQVADLWTYIRSLPASPPASSIALLADP